MSALADAIRALGSGPDPSEPATVAAHALRPSTRKTYRDNLFLLLRFTRSNLHTPVQRLIPSFLASLAVSGRAHSTVAVALTSLRFASRALGVPIDAEDPQLAYLLKAVPRSAPRKLWLHPSTLATILSRHTSSRTDSTCQALMALSFFHGLRRSEAHRIRPVDIDLRGLRLRIFPSKKSGGVRPVWAPLHPQAARWAERLCASHARAPLIPVAPPAPDALNSWLRRHLVGTRDEGATWHSLRRGCATVMHHLGCTTAQIQAQGRWESPQVAKSYICPWQD